MSISHWEIKTQEINRQIVTLIGRWIDGEIERKREKREWENVKKEEKFKHNR